MNRISAMIVLLLSCQGAMAKGDRMIKTKAAKPIVVSQTYEAPIEKVWQAITDRNQMIEWYFAQIESFKPEAGFETRFTVNTGGRDFVHVWKVVAVSRGKGISYGWRYEGYPGDSLVTWDLSSQKGRTKVTLTHEVGESFPQGIPEFTRESGIAGWTYFIQQSLKKYLEPA